MKNFAKRLLSAGLTLVVLSSSICGASATSDIDTAYNRALDVQEAAGNIYTSLQTGRWDQQQVDGISGNYSVYIPSNFEYCSPAVMILTPNDTTASAWLDSETGKAWQAVADDNAISLVVVEAQDGDNWNLNANASARDDEAYLYGIYGKLTAKSDSNPSVFDMNERALYLVGYDEGATAANKMAMLWPALFAGVAAVGGESVPAKVAESFGSTISYPFAEASTAGREDNNLPNHEIPVRVWEIEVGGNSHKADVDYWIGANDLTSAKEQTNDYATVVTNMEGQNALPEQVWYSAADSVSPAVLYGEFLADVQRFVGDPGGYLEWTIDHTNNGKHGFFLSEERFEGNTRRWFTYVPESYDGSEEYPLVIAMHGYSSAITAFTGDSRWQNVADEYGLIIVFPQAYVNDAAYGGGSCIPVPVWNNYSTVYHHTTYDDPNDVAFIKHLVDKTKSDYEIDATRIYATGHSNGSAMTFMLAQDAPEYFTAVAPIGFNWGSYPGYTTAGGTVDYTGTEENEYVLPIWCMTGSYDVGEATNYSANTKNGKTVSYWKAMNGTSNIGYKTTEIRATRAPHVYNTTTYTGENDAPLVRFTQISNNCHSYMEDISFMVWEDFFSKYTRAADGTLYYEGQKVEKQDNIISDAFSDIKNHWAESMIETAVDDLGLLPGVSDTRFAPNATISRASFVSILYRMDINAQASSAKSVFSDVADNASYANAVNWAVENEIISKTADNKFSPDASITREQIITLLKNFAEYKGFDTTAKADLSGFVDASAISADAVDAMQWAVGAELISGRTANTLAPSGSANRAEAARILVNFCETVAAE